MKLSTAQRAELLHMIRRGEAEEAIDLCVDYLNGDLMGTLFERGGFGTLQLNPDPYGLPRMKWVDPNKTQQVSAVNMGGMLVFRHRPTNPSETITLSPYTE